MRTTQAANTVDLATGGWLSLDGLRQLALAGDDASASDKMIAVIGPAMLTMGGIGMRHESRTFNNHLDQTPRDYIQGAEGPALAIDMSNKAAFINSLFDTDVRGWTPGGLEGAINRGDLVYSYADPTSRGLILNAWLAVWAESVGAPVRFGGGRALPGFRSPAHRNVGKVHRNHLASRRDYCEEI